MKIIIDIPDFIYDALKENPDCGTVNLNHIVAQGTVLPKGHGDLIDKNELLHQFRYDDEWYKGGTMKKIIECTAPVVIPADK